MIRNHSVPRRKCRGGALLVALTSAIPLLIAGGTLLLNVTSGQRATEQAVAIMQARDVSASGAQDALAKLAVDPNFRGTYELVSGGAATQISVTDWNSDGLDNDGNGAIDDEAEDDFIAVLSQGAVNVAYDKSGEEIVRATLVGRSFTEAIVQKTDIDIAVDQAVYIDDPLAQFKFAGTQFLVDGHDTNLDGTPGPNAPLGGIGTPGDPDDIQDQLKLGQIDCVQGFGGNPSVVKVSEVDLIAQMSAISSIASLVWNSSTTSYSGDIGNRDKMVPVIAHAKGNLHLNGDTKGCGILIVDGDLIVNGSFDFAGFIYATGAVTFNGGGGDKDLHGALFTLGAVSTGPDVALNGTVQLRYSSEALISVTQQLAGSVMLVSWTQR